jgi:D-glycero-D-manno-heptose 1,7-bisphosphate phosphatase
MHKILILDLDGTVRKTLSGERFINYAMDQQLIEGVYGTLEIWKEKGYRIFGCTNQGGVVSGYKDHRSVYVEQLVTMELCTGMMEGIIYCPTKGDCAIYIPYSDPGRKQWICNKGRSYRKPAPGMLEAIIEDICYMNWELIPRDEVFFVGDMDSDKQAAACLNMNFIDAEDWIDA